MKRKEEKKMELTQVLHIFIGNELGHNLRNASLHTTGKVALVDDDSISDSGRDESKAISKHGPGGVVVESDERKGVAGDGDEQSQVSVSG